MATDTSKIAKAVVGAIFIAMPGSAIIAISGYMVYTSGVTTGFGFIAVIGALLEIIGIIGIAASAFILLKSITKDLEDLKNKGGRLA
jgi:hypothetical protein